MCSGQSCTLTGLRTLIPGRSTVWSLHVLPFGFSPGFPPSPDMQRDKGKHQCEAHQLFASHTCPNWGPTSSRESNLQPPSAQDDAPNQPTKPHPPTQAGDIFVTRNNTKYNSCLYQLTYGKILSRYPRIHG